MRLSIFPRSLSLLAGGVERLPRRRDAEKRYHNASSCGCAGIYHPMAEAQMERVVALLSPDRRWKEPERVLTRNSLQATVGRFSTTRSFPRRGMGRILGEVSRLRLQQRNLVSFRMLISPTGLMVPHARRP